MPLQWRGQDLTAIGFTHRPGFHDTLPWNGVRLGVEKDPSDLVSLVNVVSELRGGRTGAGGRGSSLTIGSSGSSPLVAPEVHSSP